MLLKMKPSLPAVGNLHPFYPDTLPSEASKAINFLANYYNNVDKFPVRSEVKPGYLWKLIPDCPPDSPEPLERILDDMNTKIVPGLTHWQSPNFFAYFPANVSNAALVGDILCSGLNVVGFNWISSPAATELEAIVMDWLGGMLKLPAEFLFKGGGGGVMHASTCEALVCTLAAARDRALKVLGEEKMGKLVVYASDQTHFSFQKATKLVGISPQNFRVISTSSSINFALSPEDLQVAIEADVAKGLVPLYVCATIGATPSGAVDPIDGLGRVANWFGAWLHVDAAYAGSACICPEYRHYLNGVELSDSVSMNPHKWLLTNMECSCLWLKNPKILLDSLSTDPEILRNNPTEVGNIIDYKDWQISLSRRFRALKLWVVIRRFGLSNLVSHIRSDVELAKRFESLVGKDEKFEVVVPRKFSLVCFRLKLIGGHGDDIGNLMNKKLLEAVNSSGRAYMTHAVIGGMFILRCAVGGSLTEECHVDKLWRLLQEKASLIMMRNGC